jgi:hypothetical protein
MFDPKRRGARPTVDAIIEDMFEGDDKTAAARVRAPTPGD